VEDYPRTLLEFEDRFRTEQACRTYLVQLRWPEGFQCRACGCRQSWKRSRRDVLVCCICRTGHSVTAGTIFQDSHLPLRVWFRAMWWVTNQKSGLSALGLQRAVGVGSYRTAWTCLQKLRRAMVRPGRERLTEEVEVDELYVGGVEPGRRGGRQRSPTKALVAVAAEVRGRGIGRIRLQRIPDASGASLVGFVREVVEPGAIVHTDGWTAYPGLARAGYTHRPRVVSGSGHTASTLLPRVHRVAALLKRWLLGIHQGAVSHGHLDTYLNEFTFRFNRRRSRHRGKLFYRLVQQAVAIEPVPARTLGAKERVKVASSA
jgi:transposase-like protein